jgi:hypothetical protein
MLRRRIGVFTRSRGAKRMFRVEFNIVVSGASFATRKHEKNNLR